MKKIAFLFWVVDSLIKIFPGSIPPSQLETTLRITCAGNEYEAGQIVFRSESPIEHLIAQPGALRQVDGNGLIEADQIRCQFVGFIPIEHNTPKTPGDERICIAPAKVPDVLSDQDSIAVPAQTAQPIWVTVHVLKGTPSGLYRGEIQLQADGEKASVSVELTVYGFDVPEERHLFATNWFSTRNIARSHQVQENSDEFFTVLSAYARNMAEHRQNVFEVSPWLVKATREKEGKLTYDYLLFDRFIETFLQAGVRDRIELTHVAHQGQGGWESKEILLNDFNAWDRETGKSMKLPPEDGLGPFLSDLERHLEARGWLDKTMIHVCDEPAEHNLDAWKRASRFIHQYAPRIRRIDAIEASDFDGLLEIWVPKLSHLRNWYPRFENARNKGNELWFYICLHPTGLFMNRFLDYPLLQVRLLNWLNYRYDLRGYLHWGWNHWQGDPFGAPAKDLPPGDTHTIYPGKNGPLNSVRWEAERDSREDFEYLWLLHQRLQTTAQQLGPSAASFHPADRSMEYCRRMVHTFTDYERNIAAFRALRNELAHEIEQTITQPLVLWETLPSQDMTLIPGPITMELRGITHPGATVTVDNQEIEVRPDGSFHKAISDWGRKNSVTLKVKHNGLQKEMTRAFAVLTEKS